MTGPADRSIIAILAGGAEAARAKRLDGLTDQAEQVDLI